MNIARVAVAVCIINAVVRLAADMQCFVRNICVAGGIGSGTGLVREVGAAGLLAVAGTCAGYLDVRAAAALLGVVHAVGDCTFQACHNQHFFLNENSIPDCRADLEQSARQSRMHLYFVPICSFLYLRLGAQCQNLVKNTRGGFLFRKLRQRGFLVFGDQRDNVCIRTKSRAGDFQIVGDDHVRLLF